MPGVELVTVLVEGHIPDPVQPVLDTPMTLDEVSEVSGLVWRASREVIR